MTRARAFTLLSFVASVALAGCVDRTGGGVTDPHPHADAELRLDAGTVTFGTNATGAGTTTLECPGGNAVLHVEGDIDAGDLVVTVDAAGTTVYDETFDEGPVVVDGDVLDGEGGAWTLTLTTPDPSAFEGDVEATLTC